MSVRAYLPRVAPFGVAFHPGFISGGTYRLSEATQASAVAVSAADTLYLWPWIPPAAVTPAQLGIIISTGGTTSNMKVGIWRNNFTTMRPTSTPIIYNNSGIATTGTGNVTGPVNAVALEPGIMIWIGSVHTGGALPTILMAAANSMRFCYLTGTSGAQNPANQIVGLSSSMTYSNNISTTDLTGASFSNVSGNGIPNYVMTV